MVNLIRWNPAAVMELQPFVSPLGWLEEVEEMARAAFETAVVPGLEIQEEDKELVVKAELPGMGKRDLDVRLDGDVLTIKAEKKTGKETGEGKETARERTYGRYVRYVTLPARVDAEKVTAILKKGLLEVRLPKVEAPPAKHIEIKTK